MLNLDRVYQSMDYLEKVVTVCIRGQSHQAAQKLYAQPLDVFFFDCTTLYFESEMEDEEEEPEGRLRAKGYSKDGKPQRSQVLLALMVTSEGLSVDYELLPGNAWEGNTLTRAVATLRERHPGAAFTVVADAAMLNRENQAFLQEQGLPYVLGYGLKSAPARLKEQFLDRPAWRDWVGAPVNTGIAGLALPGVRHDGQRIIVSYSQKRACNDQRVREQALEQLCRQHQRSARPAIASCCRHPDRRRQLPLAPACRADPGACPGEHTDLPPTTAQETRSATQEIGGMTKYPARHRLPVIG